MATRTDVINYLIKERGYKTYLEIGVQKGDNISKIECTAKVGVDPLAQPVPNYEHFNLTSDDFFKNIMPTVKTIQKFDLIFIDGDHSYEQSKKDLINSLKFVNEGGLIVMHDANPYDEKYMGLGWSGEVYKTIMWAQNQGYPVTTISDDHGVAIIHPDKLPFKEEYDIDMSPKDFLTNKSDILNLITFEEFKSSSALIVEPFICEPSNGYNKKDYPLELDKDFQLEDRETALYDNTILGKVSDMDPYKSMSEEGLKDLYKEKFGSKPRGRFNREKVIAKLKGE